MQTAPCTLLVYSLLPITPFPVSEVSPSSVTRWCENNHSAMCASIALISQLETATRKNIEKIQSKTQDISIEILRSFDKECQKCVSLFLQLQERLNFGETIRENIVDKEKYDLIQEDRNQITDQLRMFYCMPFSTTSKDQTQRALHRLQDLLDTDLRPKQAHQPLRTLEQAQYDADFPPLKSS
jgi:hypothetical protein